MKEDKIMQLQSCKYEDLAKFSKVFNLSQLEYHLWIYTDPTDIRDTYMYDAEEIGPYADNSKIFSDTFVQMSPTWIRVNFGYLNIRPGKHTYRLKFVNKFTDDDFSLYFSYYIQDDNPVKPYVYMRPGEKN